MKILIIRFSSIGDIVLTSPAVRLVKTNLQAEVHYLTKKQYFSVLEKNPYIDKIYTINSKVSEVIDELKAEDYDYIIDLHKNLRSLQVKLALRKKTFSFKKENFKKWLMVNFKTNQKIDHIVNRYVRSLDYFNVKNDNAGLDFFYDFDEELLKKFKIPQFYIAISLGAKHFTKQMPQKLLEKIIENTESKFVLIGGKDVSETAKQLSTKFPQKTINLTGKININNSAQIIDQSRLLITSDTGMMHIGAALKKRIVAVWGNTVPEFGMYPYYGKENILHFNSEVKNLKCRPCSKIGFDKCPKGHFKCMEAQDHQLIVKKIKELLKH